MDDLSLEDLTAQLQAAQEKKATAGVRLSERNVVELVNKLKELGLLESTLLHTMNGKEYLTRAQLRTEIQETLTASGGRISLSELCHSLNVDLSHCERESADLVKSSEGSILSVQEELISQEYLHSIAREIKERLETMGMLRIGDLAIQYGLSQEMLLSVVSSHLGTTLKGELVNSMLYTQAYLDRLKAQLRGAIRGSTSPITVAALLKCIRLEESGTQELVLKFIRDLVETTQTKGELRSNGQWVPEVHTKAQRSAVVSLFHQNGWILLSAIQKVAPSQEEFLQTHFPERVMLGSVLVAPSFVETVDAEIEEQMERGNWCDVCSVTPMEFSDEDVRQLLLQCSCLRKQTSVQQLTDTCLVAQSFVEACQQKVSQAAVELAKEGLTQSRQSRKAADVSTSRAEEDDEDWSQDKGKGKKKGRGKAKAKQTGGAKQTSKANKETASMAHCPTMESLSKELHQWYPEMEEVTDLGMALAEKLLPVAVETYKRTIEEMTKLTDKRRQEMKERALKQLEDCLNRLWLFSRGLEALEGDLDEATLLLLKRHLIKTTGYDALDWSLRYFQLQEPGADEDIPGDMIPIQPNVRSILIEHFPPDIAPLAVTSLQNTKQDDATVLLESLDDGLEACGVRFSKRDKKAEKQRLTEYSAATKAMLTSETNAATVLALLLPLLIAKLKGVWVALPGRAMPALMEWLKPEMDSQHSELLHAFHQAVVQDLKQKSSPGEEKDLMDAALMELIPKAKALVDAT